MRIFITLILGIFLSSCSYVGAPVQMDHDAVCLMDSLPKTCIYEDTDFVTSYKITGTDKIGVYRIKGTMKYIGSQTFMKHRHAVFVLFLVNDSKVSDEIHLTAIGTLEEGFSFSQMFGAKEAVDATIVSYKMTIRD